MAIWQYDAFSNDDALDFVGVLGLLSDAKKLSIISDALTTVSESQEVLELIDVCGAVAAAALVAIQISPLLMPEDPTIEEIMKKLPDITGFKKIAAHTLNRALNPHNNEWYELVAQDTVGLEKMREHLTPYVEVLTT